MNMKKIRFGFPLVVALLLLSGCVTQKKKGQEPGWFTRGYHNITSKYNYWFNADELFRLTAQGQAATYKDNYSQILPIYPETKVDPQATLAQYDNVIKKAAYGIELHRPGDWQDDCYTLVGQAQFMKKDFETAENTFRYIQEEHNPTTKLKKSKKEVKKKTKKKKKKKKTNKRKKKKKSAAKRKKEAEKKKKKEAKEAEKAAKKAAKQTGQDNPDALPVLTKNPYKSEKGSNRTAAYPYAMVWYGRTLVERDRLDEAEILYRDLKEDPWFPKEYRRDLALAEADMWIAEKRYGQAIGPLQEGIKYTKKKKQRARLAYILAQIHEQNGNYAGAYAALETALKSKPTFEMEFNARLHLIQAAWANGKRNSADVNRELERMAKDAKNFEYRDQIYYTLATIALKDGLKPEAIAYLKQSLSFNVNNTAQRGESYLTLADLYFEAEDFVPAKNYYDSTLTVLTTIDERYDRVKKYSENLTDIARLLTTIAQNDSIVRIYNMSSSERREMALRIKNEREAAAVAQATKEALAAQPKPGGGNVPPPVAGAKPSSFYFYNESFFKKGQRDFERTWGPRKLEDNWRRKNRTLSGSTADDPQFASDSLGQIAIEDVALSSIFEGIPKSAAEIAVINLSTYEAMYNLGVLYRDKLQNYRLSTGVLETMLERYPDIDKYEKEAWYYCYLGFTDLGNQPRAQYYFDKLTTKHPKSTFARALTDPNFVNSAKAKEIELNQYYEETFTLFSKGAYQEAYDRCQDAPKKFGVTNPLMPKFSLLGAMCTGSLQGNDAYCKALSEVIALHPDSDVSTRAKEIARVLSCKGFEVGTGGEPGKTPEGKPIDDGFTIEDEKLHYFMIVLSGKNVNINDVKTAISDYNREFHKLEQIRISNIFLGADTETPIIVLRKFDNKEQVMRYFNEVKDQKNFLGEDKKAINKEYFAITQENYRRVLKNRTLEGYREFFEEKYLK